MSADNQQERLKEAFFHYISGFVDGEGTFHVAIQVVHAMMNGEHLSSNRHGKYRTKYLPRESSETIRQTLLYCGEDIVRP